MVRPIGRPMARKTALRVIDAYEDDRQPTVILWIGDLDLNGLRLVGRVGARA